MMNKKQIGQLVALFGEEKVFATPVDCRPYERDMSIYRGVPDAVVLPDSLEEVRALMRFAAHGKIPVTPRGAGTSVTGAVLPVRGGIVLDLSRMNRIRKINRDDSYVVVEPGVTCGELNRALMPDRFFPPDPGSLAVATLGGMISTNASGRSAIKYGTTRDYLLGLTAVLPSGEVIKTGHLTRKASTGFDLTHLFAAAEGTMGVITEATLRTMQRPESVSVCLAGFPTLEKAADTAVALVKGGLPLSSCELMDCISIKDFSQGIGRDLTGTEGLLMIEVDGHPRVVEEKIREARAVCERFGAGTLHLFHDEQERNKVWSLRNTLINSLSPDEKGLKLIPMAEDIGVPVSKVPEAMRRIKGLASEHGVPIVLFGHAGDGNIHTTFILDPADRESWLRSKSLTEKCFKLALELGGTVSAEHGIGLSRAPFIAGELGHTHEMMKRVKKLFDPLDIMNPGKLGFSEKPPGLFDDFAFSEGGFPAGGGDEFHGADEHVYRAGDRLETGAENGSSCMGENLDGEPAAGCMQCDICRPSCSLSPYK